MSSQSENLRNGIACGDRNILRQQAAREQSSASIDLLCKFLVNPFGNAEQARELLLQIESHPIDDTELQRGEFSFQIAFYFLACLAIAAHVDDPVSQRTCLNQLYDRVRRFYARADVTVKFSGFIVAEAERDQFVTGLRELLEKTGEKHGDISRAVMTKLGIFDLIGLRRLHEYHGVLGLPKSPLRFYLVAERLLWHYGAKRYHPVVVAVITDLLSANYNIMSKIVLSETCQVNPRDAEPEELLDFLPLDSDMPDIANKQPSKIYSAGEYLLFLFENVWPIGARKTIRFRYVIVVCGRQRQLPICFVTLENSASISNVLCVFEANGSHSNYGALQGRDVLNDFIDKGTNLMRCRFDLGEIEELWSSRQPLKPWWKALQGRRRIARRQAA